MMLQQRSMIWKDGILHLRHTECLSHVQTAQTTSLRKLEIRFGQKKSFEQTKQYIHLLNSTPTATERTICCVLDNCQKEDGVEVLAWADWPSNLSRTNWRLKSKGRNQRPKVIIF
ncbi:hypothetical protein M0R45_028379 [Rubus argutus]|uniref:Uncharacterized protein n=1 Tax=Rubus argutus TaxID=59490 RepID=A0AAW1W8Y6_RUBAR